VRSPAEIGRPGPGKCPVELVGGPHDGEREVIPVDPETLEAPMRVDRKSKAGTVTYLRREEASRCEMDGMAAWHYDVAPAAPRPEAPA